MENYAQVLRRDKTESLAVEKTLQLILERLDEQKYTNKLLFDRISQLENSLKKGEVEKKRKKK